MLRPESLAPVFAPKSGAAMRPFNEVWFLRVHDAPGTQAFWLRFVHHVSENGFRRSAEVWAIHVSKTNERSVALKHTEELLPSLASDTLKIGSSELRSDGTRGEVTRKDRDGSKSIRWDLRWSPLRTDELDHVPGPLRALKIVRNTVLTPFPELKIDGWVEIDGARINLDGAGGMLGHHAGPRSGHSWAWGHCSSFATEAGQPVNAVFEALSARARIVGPLASPKISSVHFFYQGKKYVLNSVNSPLKLRSRTESDRWAIDAEWPDLSVRAQFSTRHRGFVGVTYEDTDSSLLYCANAPLADLSLVVYRGGKLEASLRGNSTAVFELVSRERPSTVPFVL